MPIPNTMQIINDKAFVLVDLKEIFEYCSKCENSDKAKLPNNPT
jgi:hypothetical protein